MHGVLVEAPSRAPPTWGVVFPIAETSRFVPPTLYDFRNRSLTPPRYSHMCHYVAWTHSPTHWHTRGHACSYPYAHCYGTLRTTNAFAYNMGYNVRPHAISWNSAWACQADKLLMHRWCDRCVKYNKHTRKTGIAAIVYFEAVAIALNSASLEIGFICTRALFISGFITFLASTLFARWSPVTELRRC